MLVTEKNLSTHSSHSSVLPKIKSLYNRNKDNNLRDINDNSSPYIKKSIIIEKSFKKERLNSSMRETNFLSCSKIIKESNQIINVSFHLIKDTQLVLKVNNVKNQSFSGKKIVCQIKRPKFHSDSELIYFNETKYINGLKNAKIYFQNFNKNFHGNKEIRHHSFLNINNHLKKNKECSMNSSFKFSDISEKNNIDKISNIQQKKKLVFNMKKHQKLMKDIINYTSFTNDELIGPK